MLSWTVHPTSASYSDVLEIVALSGGEIIFQIRRLGHKFATQGILDESGCELAVSLISRLMEKCCADLAYSNEGLNHLLLATMIWQDLHWPLEGNLSQLPN